MHYVNYVLFFIFVVLTKFYYHENRKIGCVNADYLLGHLL